MTTSWLGWESAAPEERPEPLLNTIRAILRTAELVAVGRWARVRPMSLGAEVDMMMRAAVVLAGLLVLGGARHVRAEERLPVHRIPVRAESGAVFGPSALERAIHQHLATVRPARVAGAQPQSRKSASGTWCRRRAPLCGALIGFGAGYGLGFLLGENPFIDDFVPSADALIVGGIGAAAGGTIGAFIPK